jgi:hypothetical protein
MVTYHTHTQLRRPITAETPNGETMRPRTWTFALLAVWSFVVAAVLLPSVVHAQTSTIAECAVALTPNVNITTFDERTKYAWLNIISEKTYEGAKTAIKGSGDVTLMDLIKIGSAEASYEQFNEKRREYLRVNKGQYEHELAVSIFSQSIAKEAYPAWTQCVETVTRTPGLHAWFQEDTRGTAVLYVRYFEGPGRTTNATITLKGAKEKGFKNVTLQHDAKWNQLLTRTANQSIVATVSDNRFSDHATSAVPGKSDVGLIVSPYVLTHLAAKPCASDPCALCIDDTVVTVEAPDARSLDAVLVVDSPDKHSMPQTPQAFHDERKLDDVSIAGSGTVQVVMSGQVGQVVTLQPYAGCKAPTMLLRNSRVVVVKPAPVITTVVTGPFTQDITLRKYGDFTWAYGNVGCPNCHEAYVAQLIVREGGVPVNVDRFANVEMIADHQSGHFYSCTDGVCGVTHPDYTQHRANASPSCIGTSTCWVWRHADDSHQATQVFRVTYYKTEQKCVKNCP